ncbi:MAG: DUF4198 domain-containing protein [Thermoanaerobaculia bacterium]
MIQSAIVMLWAAPAAGHDLWLQADAFRLEQGDTLVVRQLVGSASRPDRVRELPVLRDLTSRFTLISKSRKLDLLKQEGPGLSTKPALAREVDFQGPALVAMEHALIYTEHTYEEFLDYLDHEGLPREEYEPRLKSGTVQTEAYGRSLKLLVHSGPSETKEPTVHRQPVGQPLEIVLKRSPYELDPGDHLDVQLLFRGEPLPGRILTAYGIGGDGPAGVHRERTNADGVARFQLDRAGRWLLRLVHLVPCSAASQADCADAAWVGHWAAYSFELD